MSWTFWAATLALIAVLAAAAGWLYRRLSRPAAVAQRDPAAKSGGAAAPRYVDENVLFTVYRPPFVEPSRWYTLVAFAHLAEKRPGAPESAPAPAEEVKRLAARYYGAQAAGQRVTSEESRRAIPEKELLTFVPSAEGVTFNPESMEVRWVKDVHAVDFEMMASPEHVGRVLRGSLTIFAGGLILADVPLSFEVRESGEAAAAAAEVVAESACPYDKIFPSYSHKDTAVVEQFESYVEALGHKYLRDVRELRAGEDFDERLKEKIREAEVFQLFWSWNAMASEYVRKEWSYALSLGRPNFVRPTYWEVPRPSSDALPPPDLARLHFHQFKPPPPSRIVTYGQAGPAPGVPRSRPRLLKYTAAASAVVFGCFMLSVAVLMRFGSSNLMPIGANSNASVNANTAELRLPERTRPDLVTIPGGTFAMGLADVPPLGREPTSERRTYLRWLYAQWPAHAVTVGPFQMDRTEVTNAEYAEFVKETGHEPPPDVWDGDRPRVGEERLPVVGVSHEDAVSFAGWRSRRDSVSYRLPTEEEWEFAARGGDPTRIYPWGAAWAEGNANLGTGGVRPVGSFPGGRTPQGVEDMIGNVWEWTSSPARLYPDNKVTRLDEEDRGKVVVRGGSWESRPDGEQPVTAATRRFAARDFRSPALGFRLVREL